MIDGPTIKMGGEDKIMPPLNWKAVKTYWRELVAGNPEGETISRVLHAALVRNYPDLTLEALEEAMSPGEVLAAFPLLVKISGFVSGEA
jgi:hypothetical protein